MKVGICKCEEFQIGISLRNQSFNNSRIRILYQSFTNGLRNHLCARIHLKLSVDTFDMGLHRITGNKEGLGDNLCSSARHKHVVALLTPVPKVKSRALDETN